jgi:hypothetical protein
LAQKRPYASVATAVDPGKPDKYGAKPERITVDASRAARATAATRRVLSAAPDGMSNNAAL